jgi:YHS domain-containing protein
MDPVCGKQVEERKAVATVEHGLHTYSFCSEACRSAFASNPEAYVTPSSQPACAACGGAIEQDDLICPHCRTPLAAG